MTIAMIDSIARPNPFPSTSKVRLPADEGAHSGAKTEWWYLNGHLRDDQGREYGFVDALFDVPDIIDARFNKNLPLMPGATQLDAAITLESEGRHSAFRTPHFHRPGAQPHGGITESQLSEQFVDKRGTWRVERLDDHTIHLAGPHGDAQLDLTLTHDKPALMMGGEGEIAMGPHGLSKYYTWTRLQASGTVLVDGEARRVEGTAWMDHQWGDMQMLNGYDGWDWFGIQLDNGADVNAFRFRGADGGNVQASVGVSNADGTQAVSDQIELTPRSWWTSPDTGVRYPTSWHITVPDRHLDLDVTPTFDNQEMAGTRPYSHPKLAPIPTYWEGSLRVTGTMDGQPVSGKAYGEFVGYGVTDADRRLDAATVAAAQGLVASASNGAPDGSSELQRSA